MDIVITLALFAFVGTLVAYQRATSEAAERDHLPGDMPRRLPLPGARDRYNVSGVLSTATVPSWG